jgi:hypothetical protein
LWQRNQWHLPISKSWTASRNRSHKFWVYNPCWQANSTAWCPYGRYFRHGGRSVPSATDTSACEWWAFWAHLALSIALTKDYFKDTQTPNRRFLFF